MTLFRGRRLGRLAGRIASGAVGLSYLVSLASVRDLLRASAEERVVTEHLFDWISVGRFCVGADTEPSH